MGFRIREFSRDYLLYPEFGADKDRDDLHGGGGEPIVRDFDPTDEKDYVWIVENDKAIILYYIGRTTRPQIPDTLDDHTVIALAKTAFNYSTIEKVKFATNIQWIG